MGLADDLAETTPAPGKTCTIAAILAILDLADHAALVAALARPKEEVPATKITEVLRAHGHRVARDAVGRHRRRVCGCEPDR